MPSPSPSDLPGCRVLVADDHAVVRDALAALLERAGFTVVAVASDGWEAVELAERHRPNVAVLDVAMPKLNGIDAARRIAGVSPGTRMVLLSVRTDRPVILEALRAGVSGYVPKSRAGEDLIDAVREVHRGGAYLGPEVSRMVANAFLGKEAPAGDPLTVRERQVLQLIAEGRTTKEIAAQLKIGVKSAESYRGAIMRKLGVHHVAGLVRYAIRRGLIEA